MDLLNKAADAIGDAANAVGDAVNSLTTEGRLCKKAQETLAEYFKKEDFKLPKPYGGDDEFLDGLEVKLGYYANDDEKEWLLKTGINSIVDESTWEFLANRPENKQSRPRFEDKGVARVILNVVPAGGGEDEDSKKKFTDWVHDYYTSDEERKDPTEDGGREVKSWVYSYDSADDDWRVAVVMWTEDTFREDVHVWFCRHALTHGQDSDYLDGDGQKCHWCLREELMLAFDNLHPTEGTHFFKSGRMGAFMDDDKTITSKDRWFQFRHWCMFWFSPEKREGFNCPGQPKDIPRNADGSTMRAENVLHVDGLPQGFKMPEIKLPSFPSHNLPQDQSPASDEQKKPEDQLKDAGLAATAEKKRPKGKWAPHGCIEIPGLFVKVDGTQVTLSGATIHHFWEKADGTVITETRYRQMLKVKTNNDKQALGWKESLMSVGVKEGEVAGCCCTMM